MQNLEVVKRWLREDGGGGGVDDEGGLKGRKRRRRRYGGMIFTSQRAVEGFAGVVGEVEGEIVVAAKDGDGNGVEEVMVRDEGGELSMMYPSCKTLYCFSQPFHTYPASLVSFPFPFPSISKTSLTLSQPISINPAATPKLTSSFCPPSPASTSIPISTFTPLLS